MVDTGVVEGITLPETVEYSCGAVVVVDFDVVVGVVVVVVVVV
jgi:hypothetical protein